MPASSSRADEHLETNAEMSEHPVPKQSNRLWPRTTTTLLLLVGIIMAAIGFATVMFMPDMTWHSARDAELRATYDAYQETGTLLIKETGSGSYGVQAPADGPLTFATWDDDPGSYIIASLMGDVTGSDSPYPGLKLAQALLIAMPLIWLPLAVARIVGRARAGYALVLLPLVTWLFNHGATLVGTEYGLSDRVNTLPVYSLYGTAASLAFLSLALIALLSTYRMNLLVLTGATIGISVLAGFGNMSRSLSGMGIAAAVGVLWWIHARGRWRWVAALTGAVATIALATVIQTGVMTAINVQRAETTGQAMAEAPDAHTAWHSLYLGLSYPQPLNGQPSRFDVIWSDEYGWQKAREIDPEVLVASEEYDEILQSLYLDEVRGDPIGAVKLYVQKALYLGKHFGGLLLFIAVGFVVGMSIRSGPRARLARVLAISTPLLLLGLVPAIMVMPMLYYYSELAAVLGLLAAVSLGIIVWALSSWPARTRILERRRTAADSSAIATGTGISVVVDQAALRTEELDRLSSGLDDGDELIVVSGAETSGSPELSTTTHRRVSAGGIGQRLRSGILATTGDRVLMVGQRLMSEPADLVESARRTHGAGVHVHPGSDGGTAEGLLRRLVLGSDEAGAGQVFVLDGEVAREVARTTQESGDLWFDEFAFALASADALRESFPLEVKTNSVDSSEGRRGTVRALRGFLRIALRREEFVAAGPESGSKS